MILHISKWLLIEKFPALGPNKCLAGIEPVNAMGWSKAAAVTPECSAWTALPLRDSSVLTGLISVTTEVGHFLKNQGKPRSQRFHLQRI